VTVLKLITDYANASKLTRHDVTKATSHNLKFTDFQQLQFAELSRVTENEEKLPTFSGTFQEAWNGNATCVHRCT